MRQNVAVSAFTAAEDYQEPGGGTFFRNIGKYFKVDITKKHIRLEYNL